MYIRAVLFFPLTLFALLLAGAAGTALRQRFPKIVMDEHAGPFGAVQAAVLALPGLLLGFSFSMGVGRYDSRKNAEIGEANAIGTAFERTGSMPGDVAERQRALLRRYTEERIRFYEAGRDWAAVANAAQDASGVQTQMVAEAEHSMGDGKRDAVANGCLGALTGMGDAAEIRQAALENGIPTMAWFLLITVSVFASFLVGLGMVRRHGLLLVILPVVVAASLTLIRDLDTPRGGLIRVRQDSMRRVQAAVEGAVR